MIDIYFKCIAVKFSCSPDIEEGVINTGLEISSFGGGYFSIKDKEVKTDSSHVQVNKAKFAARKITFNLRFIQ